MGPAAPTSHAQDQKRPLFKQSTKQQLQTDSERNMGIQGVAKDDDHRSRWMFCLPNERETTQLNPFNMNCYSTFKDETLGLQDYG